MNDVEIRLTTSEVVEGEENTIVVRGYYYDGYDIKIKFTRNKVLDPLIEMEQQLCASTGEAFGTIYGNGKLLMSQPRSTYLITAPAKNSSSSIPL